MITQILIGVLSITTICFSYLYLRNNKADKIFVRLAALKKELEEKEKSSKELQKEIDNLKQTIDAESTYRDSLIGTFNQGYEYYKENLESNYREIEKEYDYSIQKLEESKQSTIDDIQISIEKERQELQELKERHQSIVMSQSVTDRTNHMLKVSDEEVSDIVTLESIKKNLNQPRILSMLIWKTFYQKPYKDLCLELMHGKQTTGIYKITNIQNNKCYIGQAVDIEKRFSEHIKKGLGIDTPVNNKLYKAMQKDGVHSFSFEVLEECSKEELNKEERYFIDFYNSVDYGYNTLKGVFK